MNINLQFVAVAAGTVDAITATYAPVPLSLMDRMMVLFRATGANATTTPTFNPNGLGAKVIVKKGGVALAVGDITGAGFVGFLVYDANNERWELLNPGAGGGGGTGTLQEVTDLGNTTTNDIQLLSNAEVIFGAGGGVLLDNSSRLREGTIDAGLGGSKGIAQICAVGYELKWEAGRLYVMDGNGIYIRFSLYNFNITPTASDDNTKGYLVNSLWLLDDNTMYICTDATTGAAVWVQYYNPVAVDGTTITGDGTSGNPLVAHGGILKGTASGTDTFTTTITGVTAYNDGDAYLIRFTNGNTTGCTLNINSLGAKDLYQNNDGLLIGGDIESGAEMFCIYNSSINGFQLIGTSPNTLLAYVTNDDSVTITKGQPVYAFSGTGDRLTVKLASNTADSTSAQTVGLVLSTSIAANQKGYIIINGLLSNLSTLPTSTFSDGDAIYLGATAGTITNVKPSAPNHLVYLGFVTTASPGSAGRMYVRVQNGYEMDEIHDVKITAPLLNNQGLFYTTSNDLWENKTIISALSGTKSEFDSACSDGNFVFQSDALGTPSSGTLTNCNGLVESGLTLSDNTTNDVSTSKHGFTPKAPNDTTKFLRGDGTWNVPTFTNPEGWTVIVKSANQNVTGSTFTDDTDLQFSVVAGGNYLIQLLIATSGDSSTNDYQFRFALSTGLMTGSGSAIHRNAANTQNNTAIVSANVINTNAIAIGQNGGSISSSSGVISASGDYAFYVNSNATIKFQFACALGTTSIARTWKGSILKYKRLD